MTEYTFLDVLNLIIELNHCQKRDALVVHLKLTFMGCAKLHIFLKISHSYNQLVSFKEVLCNHNRGSLEQQ